MTNDEANNEQDKRDYSIGYGKPPEVGRFRKGESGNPKGRPRKKNDEGGKNLAAAFVGALEEEVTVLDGTKQIRITRKQMLVRSLVEKSAKGSKRALRKLLKLRETVEKSADDQIIMRVPESAMSGGRPFKYLKKPVWAAVWPDTEEIEVGSEDEPRIVPSFKLLIELELDRKVWVNGSGERKRMAMRDIIATQFTNAAAAGDEAAIDLLLKLGVHQTSDPKRSRYRIMIVPSTPESYRMMEEEAEWKRRWKAAGSPEIKSEEHHLTFYPPKDWVAPRPQ